MRIVSLDPAATDILLALGAGAELVGVTHACRIPDDVRATVVTVDPLAGTGYTRAELGTFLRAVGAPNHAITTVDPQALAACEPDVIVAQSACDVCSPAGEGADNPWSARFVGLAATSLGEVFADIRRVGRAVGREPAAAEVIADARGRLSTVARATRTRGSPRPRVLVLEWADPPMGAGRWIPELVEAAGGTPVLATQRRPSAHVPWKRIREAAPEVVVFVADGLDVPEARGELSRLEAREGWDSLPAVLNGSVAVLDGTMHAHRPTHRLAETVEVLASLVRPGSVPEPTGDCGFVRVT